MPGKVPNFSDTSPAPPVGCQNTKWQEGATTGLDPTTGLPVNPLTSNVPNTGGAVVKTANYAAQASDCGLTIVFSSASNLTYTLLATAPVVPSGSSPSKWRVWVVCVGTGNVTVNPNGLNLNGSATSLVLSEGTGVDLSTDGTNYFYNPGGGGGGGGTGSEVQEIPSGTLNGTNVTFTLSHTPTAGTLSLYLNGVLQTLTRWYSLSSSTITFVVPPRSPDQMLAVYLH